MNTNLKATLSLVTMSVLTFASAALAAPGDVELWNTDKVAVGLNEGLDLKFEQEFRLADGDLHYEHTDAGLKVNLVKGLSTSLRYRNVVEFDAGETDMEHRPHWNLTSKLKISSALSVKNNVRVEYRIREGKDNNLRYRDRATISYKWGRVSSYVSDEIFVEKGEFIRNRLYFGINSKVVSGLKVGAFYMRRTQEKDNWQATHMVGVNLAVSTDLYSEGDAEGITPAPSSGVIGQGEEPRTSPPSDSTVSEPAIEQPGMSTTAAELTGVR